MAWPALCGADQVAAAAGMLAEGDGASDAVQPHLAHMLGGVVDAARGLIAGAGAEVADALLVTAGEKFAAVHHVAAVADEVASAVVVLPIAAEPPKAGVAAADKHPHHIAAAEPLPAVLDLAVSAPLAPAAAAAHPPAFSAAFSSRPLPPRAPSPHD